MASGGRPPRDSAGSSRSTKPRIIELLLVTTIPAMIVAADGWPGTWLVIATLIGGTLAAGGANAINMVVDRDIDRLMPRTQHRPLVTGVVAPAEALVFALALEVAAFVWLALIVNLLTAVLALSATLFYVFVYTLWLKRTSRQNIVIGGAAGAVPVLVGWAAVTGSLAWAPFVMFLIIFLWTPPHFWALAIRYADDYRAAAVPMLPAVVGSRGPPTRSSGTPSPCSPRRCCSRPLPTWERSTSSSPSRPASGSSLSPSSSARHPTDANAMRLFTYSISYVTLLFAAMAVDVLVR